ncbi:arsenate reductase (glutaredoxin) [Aliisedimentitalea scapharcae]|uniref:Arsenate reductase n=1 Tax=Aliisedimentitalea scapharcae TaxID=1524259 RepID=A0ABZ2XSZ8_9RHOB|nr:arsenate reductase (glutaredoxin) [Rhodobacteraceae bacterium M382]
MITYWHNPRCSKSRAGLALLQDREVPHQVRLYLQDTPSAADIRAVQQALGLSMIQMMRQGETAFKELGLSADSDEDTLVRAMVAHPILIERPIAISGARAVIGRPVEAIETLL